MQKEKECYTDRSRLRFILFMVLSGICSGIAVFVTLPLVDGSEFSWGTLFAASQNNGSSVSSGNSSVEETTDDNAVFGNQLPENYTAQRSEGGGRERYTASYNNTTYSSTNSQGSNGISYGDSYTTKNTYAGRNMINTNQTPAQLLQTPNTNATLTTRHTQQVYNSTTPPVAVKQPGRHTENVADAVVKAGNGVKTAVTVAKQARSSSSSGLPPDDDDPVDVPFDGGLTALLITGVAYGAKRIRTARSKFGSPSKHILLNSRDFAGDKR